MGEIHNLLAIDLGAETTRPGISPLTLEYNFTNEGGMFGTWRLLKNVVGLWLMQECRRAWAREGENLTYDEITRLAVGARPFLAVIDLDNSDFLPPGDMPGRIEGFCQKSGQAVPHTKGEIIRVALESIALKYRFRPKSKFMSPRPRLSGIKPTSACLRLWKHVRRALSGIE